jgi:crotonobetainyl-CoA:carnitine CoA-transferase CaiB-like acyl-CoA transferase
MLSPYRVLDLTDERGLLCGQMLADLGADVIAVEPPGGSSARRLGPFRKDEPDPNDSLYWWAFSRNKRGVTLDIESEEGRAALRGLVEGADFLIESYDPGHLDRLGLGYEALAAINPRLVMVSITPFGQEGPKSGWAADDLTLLAASGVMLITGDEDRPPLRLPVTQAYLHAGAEAAAGALIAHAARERDGIGQHVDVSIQTSAMMATQSSVLMAPWGEAQVGRISGGVKLGPLTLQFVYPCKDGHVSITFLFGTVIGPFTQRLMAWMCEEGFVDEATRDKDWINYVTLLLSGKEPVSELMRCQEVLRAFTLAHTKAELIEGAKQRALLLVPVSTTADVVHSEQLAARHYWTPVEHPEHQDAYPYPGPFAKFTTKPITYRRRAPLIGEHNAELLSTALKPTISPDPLGSLRGPLDPRGGPPTPGPLPALAGLKVLDFTWVFAAPAGIRFLADYGATVIHVESATRPDALRTYAPYKDGVPGAERSGQYANVQAGKLGLSLNLKHPLAREAALRLVKWSDIVVESYSPKAMRAWNMHYEALREVKPNLIMMSSCLNGQTGPHAMLAGFGTMGAQLAGFGGLVGWPDRAPAGPFVAYTDYVSPKFIVASLMAAVDHRRRTGEGQFIDLSQAEATIQLLGPVMLDYTVNGRVQSRAGNTSPDYAPHGVYPATGEDRWVAVVARTEAEWQGLCRATGEPWDRDPRFATLAARLANREALDQVIGAWTATRDVDEIEQALQAVAVPVHRASTSADAVADPQLLHREHFITVEHPEMGQVVLESSRMRFSCTPASVKTPGPLFGQHNEQVLREIAGMSDDEITEMIVGGALE